MDIAAALDAFVFHDEAGEMGRLAHDLGNVYQEIGVFSGNASALFNVLQMTPSKIAGYINPINDKTDLIRRVEATLQRIDEITDCLPKARMRRADAGLPSAPGRRRSSDRRARIDLACPQPLGRLQR